jgi:tRNA nucleotidyltransferase (CCA-adding enzyme)
MKAEHRTSLFIDTLYNTFPAVRQIVTQLDKSGVQTLLVGGAVRDMLLGRTVADIKDFDIEVYHLSIDQLEKILKNFGPVRLAGKSFGVLKIDGLAFDWSIPRVDSEGRKPSVVVDPDMDFKKAFSRRDLTINAIGVDLKTHELIDPFGGVEDLKQKILSSPDLEKFSEDPLRLLRVMQFVARFEATPDDALNTLCKTIDIRDVSAERIESEFHKLLLCSVRPSLGLRWLDHIDRLKDILPALAELKKVPQGVQWHPEGHVLEHSLQAVDAAARYATQYESIDQKLTLLYAALFHDIGKKETTVVAPEKISSHGHAEVGAQKIVPIISQIESNKKIIAAAQKLILYHMYPGQYIRSKTGLVRYKWLALYLSPDLNIAMLANLARSDIQGRNPDSAVPLTGSVEMVEQFVQNAQSVGVLTHPEPALLTGRDLLDVASPGPELGDLVKKAYEIQLNESVQSAALLKSKLMQRFKKSA